jgi:hypothetical protein
VITVTATTVGSSYEVDLTALTDSTNLVREGSKIKFLSNGGSNDGTVACSCQAVIRSS